jgi:hypothetical protein
MLRNAGRSLGAALKAAPRQWRCGTDGGRFAGPVAEMLGLATVVLGARELDQLDVFEHVREVTAADVEGLTGLREQRLPFSEPVAKLARSQVA